MGLRTSKGYWPEHLITNLNAPDTVEISNYKPFDMLKTLVSHNVFFQLQEVKNINTVVHSMKKGAGINWHNDGNYKYGATYYLNHKWHEQWGGEFMFKGPSGHGFLPVVGNSLVVVKSPLDHKVNPVLTNIIPRISIQLFMK